MRVLITGGTGFLGQRVTADLLQRGHEVVRLARPGRSAAAPPGLVTAAGDVTDRESIARALAAGARLPSAGTGPPIEGVVHLAALVKMWSRRREDFDDVNVRGLENTLDAARAAGVGRVVHGSSFMALGPSLDRPRREDDPHPGTPFHNDYERTKHAADAVARRRAASGEPIVCVYPGVVYGPGELTSGGLATRQVLLFMQGKLPGILGPGDRSICYAYIDDVARGVSLALEKGVPGRRYILGGENATLLELLASLARVTGRPAPRRHIPYFAAWLAGRAQWERARLTGREPELTHQVVGIYRHSWALDCERARRELGYTVTPLEAGLRRTVGWLREGGHAA